MSQIPSILFLFVVVAPLFLPLFMSPNRKKKSTTWLKTKQAPISQKLPFPVNTCRTENCRSNVLKNTVAVVLGCVKLSFSTEIKATWFMNSDINTAEFRALTLHIRSSLVEQPSLYATLDACLWTGRNNKEEKNDQTWCSTAIHIINTSTIQQKRQEHSNLASVKLLKIK